MTDTAITQDLDADGILTLTIDVPGQTMNVITPEVSARPARRHRAHQVQTPPSRARC